MCVVIEVMSSHTLHIVHAVKKFEHNRVQVLLLGIGGPTHYQRNTHNAVEFPSYA